MGDINTLIIRAVYMGLITGIVIAIPMGPAGLESVRWTLTQGLRKGILVAAGSLIADTIDVMFINFGLLDLIEKNKLVEIFFWLLSGLIIFYIGYKAIKDAKNYNHESEEESSEKQDVKARPLFIGFIINFTNPMTHFFWLTLSSTVIRPWRSAGTQPYFAFTVFMLIGMFLSLLGLNYLASKGKNFKGFKLSHKITTLIAYGIALMGSGFILYGLYKLLLFLTLL